MEREGRRLSRFEWSALALVAGGLAARLLAFWYRQPDTDPYWYIEMGESLRRYHEFKIPWHGPDVHTHHFPPAFPALLALAFAIGGTSVTSALVVGVLAGSFTVAVATLTTWDLYGRSRGIAVGAIVATFTTLVEFDRWILSESLVVGFFALTIWAILKSLDKPPYILVAGLFAGLGYLTKASMGPFFLLAGAGGFLWRFYYVRWKVFTDKWYMAAAALFVALVVPWAWRNVLRHGSWETQPVASRAIANLFADPAWPLIVLAEAAWSLTILALFALPFLPEVWRSRSKIREERTSALWLGILTPSFVALFFIAAFYHEERWTGFLHLANFRYLVTPLVPLLWLAVRDLDLSEDRPPGAPTAGRELIARHRALAIGGVALLSFLVGTDLVGPYLSMPRFILLFVGATVAIALALASRGAAWKPATRVGKDGATTWRAVPADERSGYPWLAVAALVAAIFMSLFLAYQIFPLLAAGAIGLALATPRARVLGLCAVMLAAGLVHYNAATPAEDVAREVNAMAAPGERVGATFAHEQEIWPYLREDLVAVRANESPDIMVELGRRGDPAPPEGYQTVASHQADWRIGPGTWVGLQVWGAFFGDQQDPPVIGDAFVYRRNATS